MKDTLFYFAVYAFVLLTFVAPHPVYAQDASTSSPPPAESIYTTEQLDQLLAPIALYPDALLGQVLMAATYPLEVVEAARWVRNPGNAALKGDALQAALANEDWDPSVKSLVPFPQVLEMMDTYLDWTQKLGDAFLAQQADVTTAVQRLRKSALDAGTLKSTDQQVVQHQGQTIVIAPANPTVVYVPVYNPAVIFGPWPYPLYPPYYFPPPPGYIVEPSLVAGFYFTTGVITVSWLWGWDHFDWLHHRIVLNVNRFNTINVRRPRTTRTIWVHNHYHRRGVPYPSPTVRSHFAPVRPPHPDIRRDFRGYDHLPRVIPPRLNPPTAHPPRVSPPRTTVPRKPVPPSPGVTHSLPPAFQGYPNGNDARRDAERGRESRGTRPRGNFAPPSGSGGEPRRRPGPDRDRR